MKLDGTKLVTERNKKAKLQSEAAELIGITKATLSKAENDGDISRDTAVLICDFYGLEISEMVIPESKGDAA
jgi:DNA-binding XRE family transcriptional regulator